MMVVLSALVLALSCLVVVTNAGDSTPIQYQPFNDLTIDTTVCCEHDDQFLFVGMTEVRVAFHWNISQWDNTPYKARMTFVRGGAEVGSYTGPVVSQLGLGSFAVPFSNPLTNQDIADDLPWELYVYINGGIAELTDPMPFENRVASDVRFYFGPSDIPTSAPSAAPTAEPISARQGDGGGGVDGNDGNEGSATGSGAGSGLNRNDGQGEDGEGGEGGEGGYYGASAMGKKGKRGKSGPKAKSPKSQGMGTGMGMGMGMGVGMGHAMGHGKGSGSGKGGEQGETGHRTGSGYEPGSGYMWSVSSSPQNTHSSATVLVAGAIVLLVAAAIVGRRRGRNTNSADEMEYATTNVDFTTFQTVNGKMVPSPQRPEQFRKNQEASGLVFEEVESTPFDLVMKTYGMF